MTAAIDRLIESMLARPEPWTPEEVAKCFGCHPHKVHGSIAKAVEDHRIIRHSQGRGKTTFTVGEARVRLKSGPRPKDGRPNGFVPAPMQCTRPGAGKLCDGSDPEIRPVEAPKPAAVPNTLPAQTAPAVALPDEPQADPEQAEEVEAEADEFDAMLSARTGVLVLVGATITEDGTVALTREQVAMVRGLIQWARPA